MTRQTLQDLGKTNKSKDICACFTARKAARAITQFYNTIVDDQSLGATQRSLLTVAYIAGAIPISKMAEIAVMDRTTMTRNLQPLQKEHLIIIKPGEDRRERIIQITKKGTDLLKKTMHKWEKAQIEFEKRLGSRKFDQLMSMLTETIDAIKV